MTEAMRPHVGKVRIQPVTTVRARLHRTPDRRRTAPTPMVAAQTAATRHGTSRAGSTPPSKSATVTTPMNVWRSWRPWPKRHEGRRSHLKPSEDPACSAGMPSPADMEHACHQADGVKESDNGREGQASYDLAPAVPQQQGRDGRPCAVARCQDRDEGETAQGGGERSADDRVWQAADNAAPRQPSLRPRGNAERWTAQLT